MPIELNVAKIKGRKPFAIVAGKSILAKFKTEDAARADLKDKRSFYEYWAGSVSVSVENSKVIEILV